MCVEHTHCTFLGLRFVPEDSLEQIVTLCNTDFSCNEQHPKFNDVLKAMKLQKRGTGGVDTASTDGTFDISNSDRLGKSEVSVARGTSSDGHVTMFVLVLACVIY